AGIPALIAALVGLAALSAGSAALVERGLAERVDRWDGQARGPGVIALLVLVFASLVRAAAIAALPPSRWLAVLVATAVIGRWAAMLLQALGEPVAAAPGPVSVPAEPGAPVVAIAAEPGAPVVAIAARRSLVAAPAPMWLAAVITGAVAVVAVLALGKAGILALALAALAAFGLGIEAQRRDGGLSAPVVGAVAAIGELIVLLIATI
ncbi:MAG TPA: adenosylcobinamide-GDP ribazoletransferase, partial [Kofleriaceae bacterium]